jgi:HTH-type transcriptional regulator/antitoxin HigA
MSVKTLDERRYRILLGKALPVVIETEREYRRIVVSFEELMGLDEAEMTEEEGRLLTLLAKLIEDYEERTYPLPQSRPHKMLAKLLEHRGLQPRDLWPVLGYKSRVSEILAGKRSISKEQAKKLSQFFGVAVERFI